MKTFFSRRSFLRQAAATAALLPIAAPAFSLDKAKYDISYLEGLVEPGALNKKVQYIPPSQIDASYSHVIYVNTSTSGGGGQKMWVLERDLPGDTKTAALELDDDVLASSKAPGPWRLALHDPDFWAKQDLAEGEMPAYSWPVSTGRHYKGDRRSGPTPLGIFNMDERQSRRRRGWGSPGMYNSLYIDLHYTSGRISGVAMHGTTKSRYRLLGRPDSHGCIRMTQTNADRVWAMMHPDGKTGTSSPLWGEVPRYFTSTPKESRQARRGYVRDGSFLFDETGENRLTKAGYRVLMIFFRDDV
ncbi:MAG: L,D-transpeptidase [Pseudomonadota bacterium]